jgi:hypothetical protein
MQLDSVDIEAELEAHEALKVWTANNNTLKRT